MPEREPSRRRSIPLPNMPTFKLPARRKTVHYQQRSMRPRWVLHMQATCWRFLMSIGMLLHRLAPPRPPKPNFARTIPSTVSGRPGVVTLHFYTPMDYSTQKQLWTGRHRNRAASGGLSEVTEESAVEEQGVGRPKGKAMSRNSSFLGDLRRKSAKVRRWGGYPCVINFHGGGFTLGTALDDGRWCGTVVAELNAVVVSVDYRLAPECPFPTAVEDGVDAVLWVHSHADELGIDRNKIALSGFSSGGNMAFTVPLRLYDHLTNFASRQEDDNDLPGSSTVERVPTFATTDSFTAENPPSASNSSLSGATTAVDQTPPPGPGRPRKADTTVSSHALPSPADIKIKCIVPWYPSLDYTRTREERRATSTRMDQDLPALFTDLFDDSYLHPPKDVTLDSPYLSPGVAPTALLRAALPDEIIMHTCEWDMLLDEGEVFHQRLIKAPHSSPAADTGEDPDNGIGKKVVYTMVPGAKHGWDKAPNPLKPTPGVREHYLKACREMRRVLGQSEGEMGGKERKTKEGWRTAAPRESISVVR